MAKSNTRLTAQAHDKCVVMRSLVGFQIFLFVFLAQKYGLMNGKSGLGLYPLFVLSFARTKFRNFRVLEKKWRKLIVAKKKIKKEHEN